MALQITECRGIFHINGVLNSGNARILIEHMSWFLSPNRHLILNLERVPAIDRTAAVALKQLYIMAGKANGALSIIGRGNKNILPMLSSTQALYILSDDRV
ncbi:STAS domain-containing protein [Robiginitalea sp. IMCC43444]|uniref:STAS domain-containing protein n=1 Tax=Robiginitalea sp. IMCC43444 TaxID=3459121 RepID=UPI0040411335